MPPKQIITSKDAPPAVGPYSQAVRAGNLLLLSGQLPLDPKTSTIVGDDIEIQTRQAISNIKAVLAACGLTLSDVVKTTVFMKDLQHFQKMNVVYKEFFTQDAPARSTFQVSNLPMNALIEIESIATFE